MIKIIIFACLSSAVLTAFIGTDLRNTGVRCDNEGIFVANNKSCDAYFVCHRGFWNEGFCPVPYWFNEEKQMCDHKWNVPNCDFGETTTEEIETTTEEVETTTENESEETTDEETTEEIETTTGSDDEHTGIRCQGEGIFIKNNRSCDAYFVCHKGYWYEGFCPETFWFHEEIQGCDYIWNVDCTFYDTTTEEPETTTEAVETTTENDSEETTDEETTEEPETTTEDVEITTEGDTSEETTEETTEEETTEEETTEELTTTSTTTEAPDFTDLCKPGFLGAIPHPYICNKHILCFDGVAAERFCGDDLHFSAREKICMPIEEAHCALDGTACPAVNDPENIKTIPDVYDCRGFFICFSQSPIRSYCSSGNHWNQELQTCVLDKASDCEALPPAFSDLKSDSVQCPSVQGDQLLPHPREKGKFFLCQNGHPTLLDYSANE